MRAFTHLLFASLIGLFMPATSSAQDFGFPGFAVRETTVNGVTIHTRSGGSGPAVLLLHGYGETGDMWAPMAKRTGRFKLEKLLAGTV